MKLATIDIKLQFKNNELIMTRYEFNHALACMGESIVPYGTISAEDLRNKLTKARRNMDVCECEFTACEVTLKVGKNMVTFGALDAAKVRGIFDTLFTFAERVGNNNISF